MAPSPPRIAIGGTAGAELRMASAWALIGKFDCELGSGDLRRHCESTVRYLGIEVDDAPAIAEQVDV